MRILRIKILDTKAKFKDLKQIEKLVGSDDIVNNGDIVIKCSYDSELEPLRNQIATILNVEMFDIHFKYEDESNVIEHKDLLKEYRIKH